jgi:hypothetical protein
MPKRIPVYFMARPVSSRGVECFAFQWIGQPLSSCDNCGHPFWEHTHEVTQAPGKGLGHYLHKVIRQEMRDAVERKWGTSGEVRS